MTYQNTPATTGQTAALPKTYAQHPLSAAFPAMSAEDFQALTDSIDNIGIQNPITLFEGMVIDGWHRYSAALRLGMDCPTVELGDVDARVCDGAEQRAATTQAQVAIGTTAVYQWRPAGNPAVVQTGTECRVAKSSAELAEISGVGERTIRQAKAVQTNAPLKLSPPSSLARLAYPKPPPLQSCLKPSKPALSTSPLPRKPTVVVPPPSSNAAAEPLALPRHERGRLRPSPEELAASFAAEDDRKLMHQMLHADDALASLHAEVTRLNAALRITNERLTA